MSKVNSVDNKSRMHYFCYGSNLLSKRMHVNNKTAVKYSNGILYGYKLTFSGYSNVWKGPTANIVSVDDSIVFGVIWSIDESDLIKLDKQEAGYKKLFVDVEIDDDDDDDNNGNSKSKEFIKCLTYVQKENSRDKVYGDGDGDQSEQNEKVKDKSLLDCDKPSLAYKNVIIQGAVEQKLPDDYIEKLKSIPDNGISQCELTELLKN